MSNHIAGWTDQSIIELAEEHRFLGRLQVLLLAVTSVVEANAQDLIRVGHRRKQCDVVVNARPRQLVQTLSQTIQSRIAGFNQLNQIRVLWCQCGYVDHLTAILTDQSQSLGGRFRLVGELYETHCRRDSGAEGSMNV